VPRPPKGPLLNPRMSQRGQSLVEFALSSVVLLLLVGGLVDIGRAIYISEAVSNAAREGARHGAWYDAPRQTHPYLNDSSIQTVVDAELATVGIPNSTLKTNGTSCPAPTDGNAYHNPPFANSAYPGAANQAWLYICYTPSSGPPPSTDLNVIVLYSYGPLTPLITAQFGTFHIASNVHMTVQGS
jgi:Flp pilus assembly protein TadG